MLQDQEEHLDQEVLLQGQEEDQEVLLDQGALLRQVELQDQLAFASF